MCGGVMAVNWATEDYPASLFVDTPAFDALEFETLSEMIGEEGVSEMVEIFENETRQRLRRLASGGQDIGTQLREMHTLQGAAGTVAAPRLAALGRVFELAAQEGVGPVGSDLEEIENALEAFLSAIRERIEDRAATE
jgi:HPt (histidine-containing phosphotransfer) domain-containing protein